MITVNISDLRNNLLYYFDKVSEDYETLVVTRKDDPDVVILSADEYNNLMESMHLVSTEANRKQLLESKRQLEQGHIVSHALFEGEE